MSCRYLVQHATVLAGLHGDPAQEPAVLYPVGGEIDFAQIIVLRS